MIRGSEQWDDKNLYNGDGCSNQCIKEPKFQWLSEPSNWNKLWGNGVIEVVDGVLEECDDRNTFSYDGWDSNWRKEAGFIWTRATPSTPDNCIENLIEQIIMNYFMVRDEHSVQSILLRFYSTTHFCKAFDMLNAALLEYVQSFLQVLYLDSSLTHAICPSTLPSRFPFFFIYLDTKPW